MPEKNPFKLTKTKRIMAVIALLLVTLMVSPSQSIAAPFTQSDDAAEQCNEGVQLFNDGNYDDAFPLLEAGFANRQMSSFLHPNDLGSCALALGSLIIDRTGDIDRAMEAFLVALKVSQSTGDRVIEGGAQYNIGWIFNYQGHYAEALNHYQQALLISREVDDPILESRVLNNIGWIYSDQENLIEALDAFRLALTITHKVGDRAGEATALANIGNTYYKQYNYIDGLEYYQRALAILREVGDRRGEGMALNNTGLIYEAQGQYSKAKIYYQQALNIFREVGDRRGEGMALNGIGTISFAQGRYGDALMSNQQALVILHQLGDRAGEGMALNNIGGIYVSQGRYMEALDAFQQALVVTRDEGERTREGITLNNIGSAYKEQERYNEALEAYLQALTIAREVGNYDGEGTTLNNLGSIYEVQGQYDEALSNYKQALFIVRELGDRASEGTILNNIGFVHFRQLDYLNALDYYQKAIVLFKESGDRVMEGTTLSNIGFVYHKQGQIEQALSHYEQAMGIFENVRGIAGSEEGRAGFIAQHAGLYDRAITLYHDQGEDDLAFFTSERARARAFLDSLATGYVELSDQTAVSLFAREQEAYSVREAVRDTLARAQVLNPPDSSLVSNLKTQLISAEKEYSDTLAAIESRGEQLAALVPSRSTVMELSEIQALLDVQTTLISFHVLGDEGSLAFVITHTELKVIELPEATPNNIRLALDELFQWRNPDNQHPLPLRNLFTYLILPLTDHLGTVRVGIIPHNLLHYVPFAALSDGEDYFGQRYILFSLPSASTLPFIQENASGYVENAALIFGNPKTNKTNLPSLVHAAAEVQAVGDLLGSQTYTADSASEALMRDFASRAGIIHLAAHGSYNPVAPLSSAIYLAPGGGHDGVLEVHEVYSLDLKASDLVVLSACQSNVGDLSSGDELVGMTRAFFFAGTPTVISSLWAVDDSSTEELMVAFYRHRQGGMSKAEALQAAQADVHENHPSPFYWAAFVLNGHPGALTLSPTELEVDSARTRNPKICSWLWPTILLVIITSGMALFLYSRKNILRS